MSLHFDWGNVFVYMKNYSNDLYDDTNTVFLRVKESLSEYLNITDFALLLFILTLIDTTNKSDQLSIYFLSAGVQNVKRLKLTWVVELTSSIVIRFLVILLIRIQYIFFLILNTGYINKFVVYDCVLHVSCIFYCFLLFDTLHAFCTLYM